MFSTQSIQGKHEVFNQTYRTAVPSGITFSCSQFGAYSPILDGCIRLVVAESNDAITTQVIAHATNAAYTENIKVTQEGSVLTLETGGLSYWQSIGARMTIEVRLFLPAGTGDVSINSGQLPIFVQSIMKGGAIVLTSKSSPISVSDVDAKSLKVTAQSGSVTFEQSSEQKLDEFISLEVRSGMTKLSSIMLTPTLSVDSKSGSIQLNSATNASKVEVVCKSGSIRADVGFMDVPGSDLKVSNSSGSIDVTMSSWSGFLTTSVKSGSTSVKGKEVDRVDGGWRKGQGTSKAAFTNSSGSIKVCVN